MGVENLAGGSIPQPPSTQALISHTTVGVIYALAASGQLSVPRTTTNYGDRSFAVSGPTVWNSLPAALRLDMSLSVFRTWLKTFLTT